MYSVTQRIRSIKQPYGGFIKVKEFSKTILCDSSMLFPNENISASLVGMAVDYLTRFMMGSAISDAFHISLLGAKCAHEEKNAQLLLSGITGLDNDSIINTCKIVGYDVCYRAGMIAYKPVQEINPNSETIDNIRTLVNRCLAFWKIHGPIVSDGFTFDGGYTDIISSGDGDYLTKDTLWDFKVSKEAPKSNHTLQLLVYYIMGCHSTHKEFEEIKKLGIFNPRLNTIYLLDIESIDTNIIHKVSSEVIGY